MEDIDVKYKIIEVNSQKYSMIVRYFTDQFDEDKLATSFTFDTNGNKIINRDENGSPIRCETDTNITIWQIPTPNVSELQILASSYAPRDWFRIKMAIANTDIDTSLTELKNIKNQTFVASLPPKPPEPVIVSIDSVDNTNKLDENDVEKLINSLLSNLQSNNSSNSSNTIS